MRWVSFLFGVTVGGAGTVVFVAWLIGTELGRIKPSEGYRADLNGARGETIDSRGEH